MTEETPRTQFAKNIIKMIRDHNGYIYGGAVRDIIAGDSVTTIDGVMSDHAINLFIKDIERSSVVKITKPDIFGGNRRYNVFNNKYMGSKYTIINIELCITGLAKNIISCPDISIDLHVTTLPEIPFEFITSESDFLCNSLVITPQGYIASGISPTIVESDDFVDNWMNIVDYCKSVIIDTHIKEKIAVINPKLKYINPSRVKKMMEKKYTIVKSIHGKTTKLTTKTIEDIQCPICHEGFEDGEYKLQRGCCVGSVFHTHCWTDLMKKFNKCPLCRDTFDNEIKLEAEDVDVGEPPRVRGYVPRYASYVGYEDEFTR